VSPDAQWGLALTFGSLLLLAIACILALRSIRRGGQGG